MKQRLGYVDEMKGLAILSQTFVFHSDWHGILVTVTTLLISIAMPPLLIRTPRF